MTLALENVSYSYRTKYQTVQAVKNASCRFEQGKFYAIIGKSGSGKSTLLSLASGLEAPESGVITADGEDIGRMNRDRYRRDTVSVIYQNYNLFPLLTVMENVLYPLALKKVSQGEAAHRAAEALEKVGLDETFHKRLPAMLSGGEQQRAAIARTLACGSKVILADEPTGNLDGGNSKNIVGLLANLAHEENCCVVVVTHDLSIAAAADVVYRMDSGMIESVPAVQASTLSDGSFQLNTP